MVEQAHLSEGHIILDVGCGSGTFMIKISEHRSNLEIHALDADNDILEIAQSKSHGSFYLVRLFDGMENKRDCLTDNIPNEMRHLGFNINETARVATLLGDIFLWKVQKPNASGASAMN